MKISEYKQLFLSEAQEIRSRWRTIPVDILTGYPESGLMDRALQFSPVTLLAKPGSGRQIIEAVRGILGGTNARGV